MIELEQYEAAAMATANAVKAARMAGAAADAAHRALDLAVENERDSRNALAVAQQRLLEAYARRADGRYEAGDADAAVVSARRRP